MDGTVRPPSGTMRGVRLGTTTAISYCGGGKGERRTCVHPECFFDKPSLFQLARFRGSGVWLREDTKYGNDSSLCRGNRSCSSFSTVSSSARTFSFTPGSCFSQHLPPIPPRKRTERKCHVANCSVFAVASVPAITSVNASSTRSSNGNVCLGKFSGGCSIESISVR